MSSQRFHNIWASMLHRKIGINARVEASYYDGRFYIITWLFPCATHLQEAVRVHQWHVTHCVGCPRDQAPWRNLDMLSIFLHWKYLLRAQKLQRQVDALVAVLPQPAFVTLATPPWRRSYNFSVAEPEKAYYEALTGVFEQVLYQTGEINLRRRREFHVSWN